MALVPLNDVLAFLELSADDSYNTVSNIKDGIEKSIKTYCRRDFEEATYTEVYSGNGDVRLFLNQFPITSVLKVSTGTWSPAYIYNSNVYTTAIISVFSDKVTLSYNNGTVTTLLYSTYSTLTLLIDKVNTLGSGWVGVLSSSDYGGIITTELIPRYGIDAINSQYAELLLPSNRLSDVQLDTRVGCLFKPSGFPAGDLNLYVTYKAGYSTIPDDIKYAVKLWIKDMYARHQGDEIGLSSYRIESLTKVFEEIPATVLLILNRYRKVMV